MVESLEKLITKTIWATRTKQARFNLFKSMMEDLHYDDVMAMFKDFKKVSKYLKLRYTNVNSLKTVILSIVAFLADNEQIQKPYQEYSVQLIQQSNIKKGDNFIDKEQWISYDEMINLYKKPRDELQSIKLEINYPLYMSKFTDFLMIWLYTNEPPVRCEWAEMYLAPQKNIEVNWYDQKTGIVHYNVFKNIKSMGPISYPLSKMTRTYLMHYLNNRKEKMPKLLNIYTKNQVKPFSRTVFSGYMMRLLFKYTNKHLTINSLRHIYETHFVESDEYKTLSINEKMDEAKKLLHNWTTSLEYAKVEE